MKAVHLLLLATFAVAVAHAALPRVLVQNRTYITENGDTIVFHGINSVRKSEPYYSIHSDEDLDILAYEWGMNLVRLGFSWEGYERSPGVYDEEYLNQTQAMIDRLAERGVYTIIDVHQDLWTRKYCGNGMPPWTGIIEDSVMEEAPFPYPVKGYIYEPDPETGYILPEDCGKSYWGTYYFSNATGSMFESFYTDRGGIQTAFLKVWEHIAEYFKGQPHVLAYEIINEPFPGNIYKTPRLFLDSAFADSTQLAPLYEKAHNIIRQHDDVTLLFFEPMVSNTEGLPRRSGFESGPGGPAYVDRDVFSFHYYCPSHPERETYCAWLVENQFARREQEAKEMNIAMMLTEFGAFSGNETSNIIEINKVGDVADQYGASWTYWAYEVIKDNAAQEKAVSRTYARRIAGKLLNMAFDATTSEFTLSFTFDASSSGTTEIFLHEASYYPSGFTVNVEPRGSLAYSQPRKNFIELINRALADGEKATITITRA